MRISEGVEWGIHCLVLLAAVPADRALPASRLAEFHGVPAPYLAKHLQAFSRAGLVETLPGAKGGYQLARPAEDITVLDAVLAIDGPEPAFRCTEIRRQGPAAQPAEAYRTVCGVHRVMAGAETAWRAALQATTIADLVTMVVRDAMGEALTATASWLSAAAR
jgi:Rrf2 family protein